VASQKRAAIAVALQSQLHLERGVKNEKKLHAMQISFFSGLSVVMFGCITLLGISTSFSSFDEDFYFPRVGVFMISYVMLAFSLRCRKAVWHIYEVLWCCNTAMLLAGAGMLLQRPLLVGMAACGVMFDQMSWYVDLLGYFAQGKFPLGVAKYIISPQTTTEQLITSTHHLWFIPICLATLGWRLPAYSFMASCVFTTVSVIIARAFTPFLIDRGSSVEPYYMNINAAYELWADIDFEIVHAFDNSTFLVYLPYLSFFGNFILNAPPYCLLTVFL